MGFKKIVMFLVLGLIFATSAWAQPSNWAVFVPTREQYNRSGYDSFGNFWGWPYDLTGVNHIEWFGCWFGHACTNDATAFNYYDILGDYYDCNGNLLQADAIFSGGWAIIRGTGTVLTGGIGGHGSNPACVVNQGESPAKLCRVYFDMTPLMRSPTYCTTWPAVSAPADKNAGRPNKKCVFPNQSVGNPINVATGNKYEEALDLSVSTPGVPLEFKRSYNSQLADDGPLGYGWTHNYDLSVQVIETTPNKRVIVWDEDGRALYFIQVRQTIGGETPFTGESGVKDRLKQVISTGEYLLRRREGNLTYKFGSDGKLLQISNPNGNLITFTYTGGLLTQVSNNFGRSFLVQYNADNRISSIKDPNGKSAFYEYTSGDLTKVTYPDMNFVRYAYMNHSMTDKYDTNNNLIGHWVYDTKGRVITYYSHLKDSVPQDRIDLSYQFLKTIVTRSTGVTTYTTDIIDGISVVTEIEGCSDCGSVHKRFDFTFRLDLADITSIDGGNEYTTRYTYDNPAIPWEQVGEVVQKIEALALTEQRTINYSYTHRTDDPFLLTQSTETIKSVVDTRQNKVTTLTYDTYGNILSRQEAGYALINGTPNKKTYTTSYQYNALGQLTQINGSRTDVSDISTLEYYVNSPSEGNNRAQLKAIVNALNQRTEFSQYDANGNVGKIKDLNNVETQYTYDERNRIKTIINLSTSAQTQYFYDIRGNLSYVILPVGNRIDLTYNLANKLTEIKDNLNNKTQYQYDVEGNRIREETRDPQGTLKKYLDFTYDAYNHLKKIINPDTFYTEYSYDGRGNRASAKDPRNNTTTFTYDPLSRIKDMTQTLQPSNIITRYGYDTNDNPASVTDPNGNITQYKYDDFGRKNQTTSPDTGTTKYQYDGAGNVTQKVDAKGTIANYTYDALNRLRTIQFPSDPKQNITFTYDSPSVTYGIGRLTGRIDPSGSYVFYYDVQGNLTREHKTVNSILYRTEYAYNKNNFMTSIMYPTGRTITYTHDQVGRISQVSTTLGGNPKTLASGIDYLPFGGIKALTYGNALLLSQGHDNQYRISSIVVGSILNLTYGYDPNGNINYIVDAINPPGGQVLEYPGTYSYQQGTNKLTHIAGTPLIDYGYDLNGNITTENTWMYVYNLSNQLIRVLDGANQVGEYIFNGAGQRFKKVTGGTTKIFHYDLWGHTIAETNQSGQILAEYVYLGDQLLAMIKPGELAYYYHNDHLGTPQVLTDGNGNIVWKAAYTPFGDAAISIATVENPFRFPGQYYDQETGLHYNYFRYYNPQTGRYITPDPIGLTGGIDLFTYVNNPINVMDPFGLFESPWYLTWVPGQHLFDLGMTSLENRQYGWATAYFAGMLGEQVLTALTFGKGATARGVGTACEVGAANNAARGVTNPIPGRLARVIPGEGPFTTLGRPGASDVYVTAADDIAGMNATQIAQRLGIPSSKTFTVIEFSTPTSGLASPVFRTNPGFVGRGVTAGGAREFILPNGPIPTDAIMRVVKP
jgi:RHS repeat-associated protein